MADLKEFDFPNFRNSSFRLDKPSQYLISKARKDEINGYSNLKKSMTSSTIYIGKLSFTTTEEQLFDVFSKCGEISKIIMEDGNALQIAEASAKLGFNNLRRSGLLKVMQGVTSLQEVNRVTSE